MLTIILVRRADIKRGIYLKPANNVLQLNRHRRLNVPLLKLGEKSNMNVNKQSVDESKRALDSC